MKLRTTISKYHSWYLCQISLQIVLLPILIAFQTLLWTRYAIRIHRKQRTTPTWIVLTVKHGYSCHWTKSGLSIYLWFLKILSIACGHVTQWFTTNWAYSLMLKKIISFLYISLLPTVNRDLPLQRSTQNEKNCTFTSYTTVNIQNIEIWDCHSIITQGPQVNPC